MRVKKHIKRKVKTRRTTSAGAGEPQGAAARALVGWGAVPVERGRAFHCVLLVSSSFKRFAAPSTRGESAQVPVTVSAVSMAESKMAVT